MGKIIALLPMIVFMGFFALLVFGFFFLIFAIARKVKAEEWKGEVIEKIHNVVDDPSDIGEKIQLKQNVFALKVRTDDGQIKNVAVSRQMFYSCEVGDRLEKPKGALNPKKIE